MRKVSVRIGRVHVNVRDLDRATRFYSDVLGLRVVHSATRLVRLSGGESHYDVALHAGEPGAATAPIALGCGPIGFEVDSRQQLAGVCERLTRAGARVAVFDQGASWSAHTSDPDGNKIEVFCDTRHDSGRRSAADLNGRAVSLEELQRERTAAREPAAVA